MLFLVFLGINYFTIAAMQPIIMNKNIKPIRNIPAKKHPILKNILNTHHSALKTPDRMIKIIARTNINTSASISFWYSCRDLNPDCASVAQLLRYKLSVLTVKLREYKLKTQSIKICNVVNIHLHEPGVLREHIHKLPTS